MQLAYRIQDTVTMTKRCLYYTLRNIGQGLCDLDRAKLCLVEMEMRAKQQMPYQDYEILELLRNHHGDTVWEKVKRQYEEKMRTK